MSTGGFFSETVILTMHRFSAPGLYTKRAAARVEMFCICLRRLLEDTITQDGPTSMQALQLVVLRETPLQLCSKLTSHATDQMREPPSIILCSICIKRSKLFTKVTVSPTKQD